jgi:imidazolonepropionase-like amidohydrolase
MRPLVALALLLAATAAAADALVLRDAAVVVPGKTLPRATVVVVDGKIAAVGESPDVPPLARVIDARGRTVMPGLVAAGTEAGTTTGRFRKPSTEVRIRRIDDVDPADRVWRAAREAGFTTLGVVPDALGVGGHGAIVRPVVGDRAAMTVRDDAPLVLGFSPDTATKKAFRGGFDAARKWIEAAGAHAKATEEARKRAESREGAEKEAREKVAEEAAKKEKAGGGDSATAGSDSPEKPPEKEPPIPPMPPEDPKVMPFVRALRGEIPCFVHVLRPPGSPLASGTLSHLLPLLEELGLRPVLLIDPATAWTEAARLAEAKLPVIVSVSLATDPGTGRWVSAARALREAKAVFALRPGGNEHDRFADVRHQLALLVRAGLPREAALEAVTATPAKLLGLEKRAGAIRPGRDADLVILDGDPLDPLARVERVLIAGETVYEREEAAR